MATGSTTGSNIQWAPDYSSWVDSAKNPGVTWNTPDNKADYDYTRGWVQSPQEQVAPSGKIQSNFEQPAQQDPTSYNPYTEARNAGRANRSMVSGRQVLQDAGVWDWQNPDFMQHLNYMAGGNVSTDVNALSRLGEGLYIGESGPGGAGRQQDSYQTMYDDLIAAGYDPQVAQTARQGAIDRAHQRYKNAQKSGTLGGTIDDLGSEFLAGTGTILQMAPVQAMLGGMLAPGLGSFFGGGLGGAMGTGATLGGLQGLISGGNPLKSALTGGAIGGLGYGMFGGENMTSSVEGGTSTASGDSYFDGATASNAGVTDAPIIDEAGSFNSMGSETGNNFMGDQILEQPAMMAQSEPLFSPDSYMNQPGFDGSDAWFSANDNPNILTSTATMDTVETDTETAPVEDGGAFDMSGSMSSPSDPTNTNTIFDDMDRGLLGQLEQAYEKIRDPLKLVGALKQMSMSRDQASEMRKFLESQQAQQFDHRQFDNLAQNYQDPAKRMEMLRNTPGFLESERYLTDAMQRRLATQGHFMQPGQGGAVSNNWSVPMADVVGRNAMNWDNQIFGQIQGLTGMGMDRSGALAQLAGGFYPRMGQQENKGYQDLFDALRSNSNLIPDALRGLESFLA